MRWSCRLNRRKRLSVRGKAKKPVSDNRLAGSWYSALYSPKSVKIPPFSSLVHNRPHLDCSVLATAPRRLRCFREDS
jgi:hypothetical protein